jgi:hypothetical protein
MSYDFNVLANPLSILRHVHPEASGRIVFKGGGGAPTTQNIQQTNLPEYVRPQFESLLKRAEGLSQQTQAPIYGGQRVATEGMGDIRNAYDITRQVAGTGIAGLPQAMNVMGSNIAAGQQIAGQAGQPFRFGPAQGVGAFQFGPTQQFTGATAQEYMSPYMQAVVERQQADARRQFGEQAAGRSAQAVRAGAFGGSRQAVQEGMAERDLLDRLANIQATGSQQAFEQGATQFGADRAAEAARQQAQAGEFARTQGLGVQETARVQGAQAAENRAAQQQQLQALGFSSEQAQQLVNMGSTGRAADIQAAQLLESIGKSQRGIQQEGLDVAYQDFIRQQAFPEQQLQMLSGILRGVPVQPGITQTAYAPFNPLQQLAGAGLTGIGLYRGLQ